jgi:hypothetical protein
LSQSHRSLHHRLELFLLSNTQLRTPIPKSEYQITKKAVLVNLALHR